MKKDKLDSIVENIFHIIDTYYNERQAVEIKKLIKAYTDEKLKEVVDF